jgi:3-hydroxyethyl bacteriochlorophyllide a dehydrogenase
MDTLAVVLEAPESLALSRLDLETPGDGDVVVDIEWSGISTGTERLLWSGRMPPFPGMGYPLVPGYESVGRVAAAGSSSGAKVGERVFVPGARCFGDVRGLFGGAAARVVVPGGRVTAVDEGLGDRAVLMALAATAHHAIAGGTPDLIVGHGILGRLVARLAVEAGAEPVVWERNPTGGAARRVTP